MDNHTIIGLIPAGGIASRLGKIPLSKELFPLFQPDNDKIGVISDNLLRYYKKAGISNVYFIIRKGKWDIPEYYGDGSQLDMNIGYLMMNHPFGSPFTLNQAYSFLADKIVVLGFPDIVINPEDCFVPMVEKLMNGNSSVMLGIFPVRTYAKWDMVEFDEGRSIRHIIIKQDRPDLRYGWSVAVWKPDFSSYMNDFLNRQLKDRPDGMFLTHDGRTREICVGDIFQDAINHGMKFDHVLFENGSCIDLGTPSDLKKYINRRTG